SFLLFYLLSTPPPPRSTLFPYTTLFRSSRTGSTGALLAPRFFSTAPDEPFGFGCRGTGSTIGELHDDGLMQQMRTSSYTKYCFLDRKSTRLNSSHVSISYAVFCLKKKKL